MVARAAQKKVLVGHRMLPPAAEFDRVCVVLVSTRNPLNIGAAARAMSNFGFARLRVVNPYEPSFREARSAVGAAEVLANAEEYTSVAAAVADCAVVVGTTAATRREFQHPLHLLENGACLIQRYLSQSETTDTRRVALLFGSEKRGLSNHDLSHCHWLIRIPTREAHASMNLGQAVAISLYEIARGFISEHNPRTENVTAIPGLAKHSGNITDAASGDFERVTSVLIETLRTSGYLNPRAKAPSEEKIRRLVRRLNLTETDADVWLGILRQILWKLKNSQ